jgi:putative endonuclease
MFRRGFHPRLPPPHRLPARLAPSQLTPIRVAASIFPCLASPFVVFLPREFTLWDRMGKYHYVYVLRSQNDRRLYVGYTKNLQKRLEEHNCGRVRSTKARRPMNLIYWEGCINQQDATRSQKYLKSAWGKRYIKKRVRNDLNEPGPAP